MTTNVANNTATTGKSIEDPNAHFTDPYGPPVGVHGGFVRPSRIANPGTLGLFSLASTTLMLSLYNVQTRHITVPNVVVGMAIFCGGLTQLLAGMWEFPRGNMFAATAFSSYGAFWMSYATILIPASGIGAAYGQSPATEIHDALGIYLIAWMHVTFFFLIASLRKNIGFIVLFTFLTLTFMMLAIGEFKGNVKCTKAGGGLGIATAYVAYYVGLSEMLAGEQRAIGRLPIGLFKYD